MIRFISYISLFILLLTLVACETDAQVAEEISSKAPDYVVTAQQLFSEYEANEIGADAKYKDKVLLVTGVVTEIGKDIFDTPQIKMALDMFGMEGVQCSFADKEVPGLANIAKGDTLTVKGKGDGKTIFLVDLKGCTLE